MSLMDVLTGRKPLFKSSQRSAWVREIEFDFEELLNREGFPNGRRHPAPAQAVIDQAASEDNVTRAYAASKFTVNTTTPVKLIDTRGESRKIAITVIKVGTTVYISHDRLRLLNSNQGVREGIPITSQNVGTPALEIISWVGEMWAVGSLDNIPVDVEML